MLTAAPATRTVPDWTKLLLSCLATFMIILDVVVISVALPPIRVDLGFAAADLPWVVNAYTLAFAGFLLLGGRAADIFGVRRTFLAGLAVFTTARFAAGFAPDAISMLVCRAVQGLGAAALMPATLTVITSTYQGARRGRALAVWSAVGSVGASAGSVVGGLVTDTLGWRWIFFILAPVGVAALALARYALPPGHGHRERIDVLGGLLATAGLCALVYGIVGDRIFIAAGLALLAVFVVHQTRTPRPLVPLRIFRVRSVSAANAVILCLGIGFFSYPYFLSLYLENVLRYSPMRTGLASLPLSLGVLIGAPLGGRLIPRYGVRVLAFAGTLITAAGFAGLGLLDGHGSYLGTICLPGVPVGIGIGMAITPITVAATSGVEPALAGLASGLFNTVRQVSGAIGLALLAEIATSHTAALHGHPNALALGYGRAFLVAACFALASALLVPLLGRTAPH